MSNSFGRSFLQFEVEETSEVRGHWLDQPWVDEGQREALIQAPILALPLTGRTEGPIFPAGTADFIERLREAFGAEATLAVAIRSSDYQELSLHAKAWRLPTLLLSYAVLPLGLNILSSRIDDLLPGHKAGDTTELTLIIEAPSKKALKLHFKGDARQLGEMMGLAIPRFVEELNEAPASPHQVHPHKRIRHPSS